MFSIRKRLTIRISVVAVLLAALAPGMFRLGGADGGAILLAQDSQGQTYSEMVGTEENSDEWPLAHQSYRNHRAAVGAAIDSETVDDLGVAWTFPIPGRSDFGAAASAPLVLNDTVYLQDLASNVFAINLETGDLQWEQRYDAPVTGPNGPGVGYGKLFVASGIDTFAALDLETGDEIWSVESGGDRPTGDIQPYVYDGKVYITSQAGVAGPEGSGVAFYEAGRSGHIFALDPETGETLWHFQTVQEDFWGNPQINSGAGVWYSPLVDTERGLTIWGTGNPAPFPGIVDYPNAASRPEPNLYANSIVALDAETGDLVWYNYANPNDLFDADVQLSPMLVTATIDGEARELVIGSGKMGHVIALDPKNGETVWRTPVGRHQNDHITAIPEELVITVYPGLLGGVLSPMAYADDTIYVAVINLPTEYTATAFDSESGPESVGTAFEHTEFGSGTSELVALDAATGIILWAQEFDSENYGGATVVNDLVFTATADGVIRALDRKTGEEVWTYQAPAGINAWPAVVDDTILWPAGLGENAALVALRLGADGSAAQDSADSSPEAVVQELVEQWNAGNLDNILFYYAEDAVVEIFPEAMALDSPYQGREEIRAWIEQNLADNPRVDLTIESVQDGTVAATARLTSENMTAMNIDEIVGTDEFVIEEGQIVSHTFTYNDKSADEMQRVLNRQIALVAFEEPWNEGNLEAVDAYFATDYVGHDPAFPTIEGVDAQKQLIATLRTSFPDLHFTVEEQFARGDRVANRWTVSGTHEGEFMDIAATGNAIELTGLTINRIEDGKVAESWTNWDVLGLLQQLGAMPVAE